MFICCCFVSCMPLSLSSCLRFHIVFVLYIIYTLFNYVRKRYFYIVCMLRMLLAFVISILFVLVFLFIFFAFSPLASYIYLHAPSLSPWSVPTRVDGGGDRATNLQKVSTLELTSRQPTIWIR